MSKDRLPDGGPAFDQHYGGGMDSPIVPHGEENEAVRDMFGVTLDNGYYQAIRLKQDRGHELIRNFSVGGVFDGRSDLTTISFRDPSVLEKAAELLRINGKTTIRAKGTVISSYETHDYNYPELNDQSESREQGVVVCTLELLDGRLLPFTYQIDQGKYSGDIVS